MEEIFEFLSKYRFNFLRIPISLEAVLNNCYPSDDMLSKLLNMGFNDASGLGVLDEILNQAGSHGMMVLLDIHRLEPEIPNSGLWWNEKYSEEKLVEGFDNLIARYGDHCAVIGIDLSNEPWQATWGSGDRSTDWGMAAQRLSNHILMNQDSWIVLVEGIGGHDDQGRPAFWGSNFNGERKVPLRVSDNSRLVWSPHIYGPSVYNQYYFNVPQFPDNMKEIWEEHFGFLHDTTDNGMIIGEWGGRFVGKDQIWQESLVDYLREKGITNNAYWSLSPNSHDTGGLFEDDWKTPVVAKLDLLARLQPQPTALHSCAIPKAEELEEEEEEVPDTQTNDNTGETAEGKEEEEGTELDKEAFLAVPDGRRNKSSQRPLLGLSIVVGVVALIVVILFVLKKWNSPKSDEYGALSEATPLLHTAWD